MSECEHKHIVTFFEHDTGKPAALWACALCSEKFVPISQVLELEQKLADIKTLHQPSEVPPQGVQCLVAVTDGLESWWRVDQQENNRWQCGAKWWKVLGWRQLGEAPKPPEGE